MAIELQCPSCRSRLRVPDESAGKNARCPTCQTIVAVPSAESKPLGSLPDRREIPEPQTSSFGQLASANLQGNPYSPPEGNFANPTDKPPLVHGQIDVGMAFSAAWTQFTENAAVLVGAMIVQFAVVIPINFAIGFGGAFLVAALNDPNSPLAIMIQIGSNIMSNLIQYFFVIGYMKLALAAMRRQSLSLGILFSGGPQLLRYLGAIILLSIAIGIGFLLLIIPGIYVALTYWSSVYFVVDRDAGVLESFSLAKTYAQDNRMQVFLLGLAAMGLSILGVITCGLGFLIIIPLINLVFATAWLMMTGQKFAGIPASRVSPVIVPH